MNAGEVFAAYEQLPFSTPDRFLALAREAGVGSTGKAAAVPVTQRA